MVIPTHLEPGSLAPVSGVYQELNVLGGLTGRWRTVKEGEQLPSEQQPTNVPAGQRDRDKMRPVQMPKSKPQPQLGQNPDTVSDPQPDGSAPTAPAAGSTQPK